MVKKPFEHFHFLDGLRFLCALWVVFSHLGAPPIFTLLAEILPDKIAPVAIIAQKGFGVMFNGAAAVVAFFIISGFCIHYPYASGKALQPLPFYLARGARIVVPVIFASALAHLVPHGEHAISLALWSLYAEIIYYAIYPLIFKLINNIGINKAVILGIICSTIILIIPDAGDGYLWSYGIAGTWLLCLPMWLLGCWVAEAIATKKYNSFIANTRFMPILRITILLAAGTCGVLSVTTPIQLKYSMLVFSPLCAFWIFSEFLEKTSFSWFKNLSLLGRACFSIYLMHTISPLLLSYGIGVERSSLGWPLTMASVIVFSTLFYFSIERPSHMLSKRLSRKISNGIVSGVPAVSDKA